MAGGRLSYASRRSLSWHSDYSRSAMVIGWHILRGTYDYIDRLDGSFRNRGK